ncbi:hypothetical protein GCM10022206_03890 [Streptomyces chiangmaiensis]
MRLVRQNDEKWARCPLRRAVPAARCTSRGSADADMIRRFLKQVRDGGFAEAGPEDHL